MKRYTFLNIICVLLIAGAVLGTMWFAPGYIKGIFFHEDKSDIPVAISRVEIQKTLQTSTPKTQPTSTKPLPPKVTSTKTPTPTPVQPLVPAVPETFNLAVPFTSQAPEKIWSEPWQDACEEAAVIMLDAYYNDKTISLESAKHDIVAMVKWEEDLSWEPSIELEKIQKIFTDYLHFGHTTKIIPNPTVDDIKKYVANGQPVLVVADGKILPNSHFQNGGPSYHALLVRGYTKDSFITNDPGTQFGENFKYKYQDLMNAIHDWNGGDVVNGRRVVLVVE